MKFSIKLSLLGVALAFSLAAGAQTISTLPDPMLQAVRKAVVNNPEVQAKWNAFLAADSQRDIAKSGFFPTIDFSANAGTESRISGGNNLGTYDVSSAQISLNQILFDGFFTSNEVKRLSAAKLTRYYELLEASENIALEAAKAYADVVRYRELVDLTTENYVEHKQATMLVEERANSGVGRRVDVEQANGRLALAESNLLTELTNLHDVSARFLRVVGEKPATSLPSLPEPFTLGNMPASSDILLREGMMSSPTLLAAVQNARASRIAIDTSKAAYMPRLDFQLYANEGNNSGGVVGRSSAQGAALNLTYNLYRGGADKAREKQTVSLADQARDLQEKACRDVRQTLSLAYSDSRALKEQLVYIDQHRLATEKTREAYRQQFDIGQRTLLDLLDTQNEFFEASRSYINSRHDQALAQARTLAGMGQLVSTLEAVRPDLPNAQDAGLDGNAINPEDLCPLEETVVDTLEKIKADVAPPPKAPPPVAKKDCGRVTLLPDDDGKVGRVYVKGDKEGDVKLDKAYAAAIDDCDKVTLADSDPERYKAIMPKLPEPARTYRINFELDKAVMVPESAAVFSALLEDYRATGAPEVTIIGHADKLGSPAHNLRLSQRRAEAVYQMLTQNGEVPESAIERAWRGDSDPLPGTEADNVAPVNRRVDVKIQ